MIAELFDVYASGMIIFIVLVKKTRHTRIMLQLASKSFEVSPCIIVLHGDPSCAKLT